MYRSKDENQPDELEKILALRPADAAKTRTPVDGLREKIRGAVIGRCIGCTLGVPVENWSVLRMTDFAITSGTSFPPVNYWEKVSDPDRLQYGKSRRAEYSRSGITKVPVDDDITYMMLNMLLLSKYGKSYTLADVAGHWTELLPCACTAEDEALHQLKYGTKPEYAALFNPYVEWIGAAIRADAFGYACAGDPEGAARTCYNDAYLTHRKNGIYGEMFCAAAIAAAFTSPTPLDACREGMRQIPVTSELYAALEWAFSVEDQVTSYAKARMLIDEKFPSMHRVHTINNICAIIFALMLGGDDFTKCVGSCIAIGLDNDCTGATLGSIFGACRGIGAIPAYWYENFHDRICTYINGYPEFSIEETIDTFESLNMQ